MGKTIEQTLKEVYYQLDSPASFSGQDRVYQEAHRRNRKISRKDVHDFLFNQRVYTMHRQRRKKFTRLATRPSGLHTDWQADLAIFDRLSSKNDGFKYLLVCIDVLSRKIYVAPARSKQSEHMIEAFEKIFSQTGGVVCSKLYTDRGLEFEAKKMKEYFRSKDIDKRVVYSPDVHAAMAERANRTIKERLYRYFSEHNTLRWIEPVQKIVEGINASVNRVTGMKPNAVNFGNAQLLFDRLYKDVDEPKTPESKILNVGQIVRISKEKGKFEKSYLPNFSDELFRVKHANQAHHPVWYKLEDLEGEEISGIFYREELAPTSLEQTQHRIAEVLKSRTRRGITEHFVRWVGYTDNFNSWIKDSDIIRHQ